MTEANNYQEKLDFLLDLPTEGEINLFDFIDENISWEEFKKITDLINVDNIPNIDTDIYGNTIKDKVNPTLRMANKTIELDNIHHLCKIRCRNDVEYFAENFCKITTLDYGKIKIPLRIPQRKALKIFTRMDEKIELQFIDQKTDELLPEKYYINAKDIRFSLFKWGRQEGKCLFFSSFINIRNKKTNKIEKITVSRFYFRLFIKLIKRKVNNIFKWK